VSERKTKADQTLSSITKLSGELADASGDLPSYDQRSYNQALKELQEKLVTTQTSHAPRAKFSFKNKRLAAPVSEANSTSTSRSTTPAHLRDSENSHAERLAVPAMASPPTHLSLSRHVSQDRQEPSEESSTDAKPSEMSLTGSNAYLRHPQLDRGAGKFEVTQYEQGCIMSDIKSSVINVAPLSKVSTSVPSSLTLNNVSWSFVLAPNIRGPAHITKLSNSTIVLSCHQFRMHNSHHVDVYLHCSSRPIIEDCSDIRFTTIPDRFVAKSEGEVVRTNMYSQVDDFKWLRAEPSPNWRLMKEDESIKADNWDKVLENLGALDNASQQGHKPDVAGILFVLGRSEAENIP